MRVDDLSLVQKSVVRNGLNCASAWDMMGKESFDAFSSKSPADVSEWIGDLVQCVQGPFMVKAWSSEAPKEKASSNGSSTLQYKLMGEGGQRIAGNAVTRIEREIASPGVDVPHNVL